MAKIMKKTAHLLGWYVVLTIVIVVLSIIFKTQLLILYQHPEIVRDFISGLGIWGPLILIFLNVFQAVFLFIPGIFILVAGGYAFGIFWGTVYCWIGLVIGASIIFLVGRKLGRPFIEKIVKKDTIQGFDNFFTDRTLWALLVSRTIPFGFPHDVISLVVSLTNISFFAYILVTAIGFIPHTLVIVAFGNQLTEGFTYNSLVLFSVIGFLLVAFLLWKPVKQALEHRRHRKIEYELTKMNLG